MAEKRKRIVLTIKEKLELIKRFEEGQSAGILAADYGVGVQTIRDLIKNKEKLIEFTMNSDSVAGPSRRKTLKSATHEDLDKALIKWFQQKRAEGVPVSGPMCSEKAKYFFNALGLQGNFNASSGWLTRFKQRHGIRELQIQGETLSSDVESSQIFCREFNDFIASENLSRDQIYNADESGVYWKMLPQRTLATSTETHARGHKLKKERMTVMCCANASGGHKMRLLVIGKAKKPRSFRGSRAENLPVDYYSQKGAWMDRSIFKKWFHEEFVLRVRSHLREKEREPKAVLVLDNAPSHPDESELKSDDGKIFVKYLPPNVTAIIQPMDQGVIALMKRHYRHALLREIAENDSSLELFWKKLTILDAIYIIDKAWKDVNSVTLARSWRKILPETGHIAESSTNDDLEDNSTQEVEALNRIDGFEDVTLEDLDKWFDCDKDQRGFQIMDDADIISQIQEVQNESDNDSDDSIPEDTNKISHNTALQSISTVLEYMEQNQYDFNFIISAREIRSKILNETKPKQSKITNFFSKVHNENDN